MAINIGQHAAAAHATVATTAGVTTQGSGSTFVLFCIYDSGSFTSVADSKGNTYASLIAELNDGPGGFACRALYCENGTGGASHTFTLTAGLPSVFMVEVTGGLTSGILDKAPTALQDNASPYASTTTGVLSQAAELAIGFIGSNCGGTANHVSGGSFAAGDRLDQVTDGTNFWTGATNAKVVAATTALATSWTEALSSRTINMIATFKEGAGGGTTTTINPTTAALSLLGRAASANAFSSVTIKEVFINEAGSPVTNRTGMSLLVWYGGSPVGAPDLSYSALTTDANGTASWSIATGSLVYNQPIFYVATDGGASLSQYTCARLVPIYA